ncbi:unnamed protein product, partial [Dicrocoelium dendriticum]
QHNMRRLQSEPCHCLFFYVFAPLEPSSLIHVQSQTTYAPPTTSSLWLPLALLPHTGTSISGFRECEPK